MLSWIQSKLNIILGVLLSCALIWGGLSSHLYVGSQKELTSLQSKYTQLQSTYEDLSQSKDRLSKSYQETQDVLASLQAGLLSTNNATNKAVTSIQNYKQKCVPISPVGEVKHEKIYVDVDAPFDPEFIRLSE